MQAKADENQKKFKETFERRKMRAQSQTYEELSESALKEILKKTLSSAGWAAHLRTTGQNQKYPPMFRIRGNKNVSIAVDPLHFLLRQFDIFEQKIIYPLHKNVGFQRQSINCTCGLKESHGKEQESVEPQH